MGLLQGFSDIQGGQKTVSETARALESLVLKQVLAASGAFRGTESSGSSLHADLFADTLAEAVSRSGGLGLAAQIERSLKGSTPQSEPTPATEGLHVVSGHTEVTSPFGVRADPFHKALRQHNGVDLAAQEGSPILAAEGGVVRRVGPRGGYGHAVEIDHGNGVTTLYGHASELLVQEGQRVEKGQPVARVGHTGRATGDHLHFEVRVRGNPVNPSKALNSYRHRVDEASEGISDLRRGSHEDKRL